jgi:DNA repair exonuclease SbcCD ATPase subunit
MDENLEIVDKKNIVTLIKELQYLNDDVLGKFDGDKDGDGNLLEKLSNLNNNLTDFVNDNKQLIKESKDAKKELSTLFLKLQDTRNIELKIETLKLDFASKKDIDELNKLIKYITNLRTFMVQKSDEINNAYIKLNRLWFEENEVLQRIEKLEKNLLSKVLMGGIGLGMFLTITIIAIVRYFL